MNGPAAGRTASQAVPLGGRLWPPPLRRGDEVAVVSPSGPAPPEQIERGCDRLRSWGLRVRLGAHVADAEGYLAGSDQDRARDFVEAWSDDQIAAVIAARGGYGALRMVDLVDWSRLRAARPKLLVGYSDVTVLHLAVGRHLGLCSVFGPMAAGLLAADDDGADPDSLDGLANLLFGRGGESVVPGSWGRGGRATGILHGGTLTLLASVVGSDLAVPPPGAVVFLEDVDEEPYRIDRMLTQLLRAGWFGDVAGVALGTWVGCGEGSAALDVVVERLSPLGVPLVAGLPAGHGPCQRSLALGRPVELDATQALLRLPPPGDGPSARDG